MTIYDEKWDLSINSLTTQEGILCSQVIYAQGTLKMPPMCIYIPHTAMWTGVKLETDPCQIVNSKAHAMA